MLRSANRTAAFFSQWLAEVARQPWLMLWLVLGPFLVLLAFGQGVRLGVPEPRTLIVTPPRPNGAEPIDPIPDDLKKHLHLAGETADEAWAREQLRQGKVDLVAILPVDPLRDVESGHHARVRILTNELDPVLKSYQRTYLHDQAGQINSETVQRAIARAQQSLGEVHARVSSVREQTRLLQSSTADPSARQRAAAALREELAAAQAAAAAATTAAYGAAFVVPGLSPAGEGAQRFQQASAALQQVAARINGSGQTGSTIAPEDAAALDSALSDLDRAAQQLQSIPPDVLASPFEVDIENIAPFVPSYTGFYAPAVLVLLLQHLGITLGALSMARIRLLGMIELLRVTPARPSEVVAGNYLSYGVLCAVAGTALAALMVFVLGVPVNGSALIAGATLALLVAVSLGVGFAISMLSSSEQQAAQIAMLVLIASVFFSGFIVAISSLVWPVRAIAYALPATYAIRTLQDVMLRGYLRHPLDLGILGAAAVALAALTIYLFRREYRPR